MFSGVVSRYGMGGRANYGLPGTYSTLGIWLRGDSLSALDDGAAINVWSDDSGQGNHFSLHFSDAYDPLFHKASPVNGHYGVDFSNSWLGTTHKFTLGDNISLFYAFTTSGSNPLALWDTGVDNSHGTRFLQFSNGFWITGSGQTPASIPAGRHVLSVQVYFNPTFNLDWWIDGTAQTGFTNGDTAGISYGYYNSGSVDYDGMRIGVYNAFNSGNNFVGTMWETCWFSAVLATADRQAIENYLKTKYSV